MSGSRGRSPALPFIVALAVMVVWGGTPLFTKVAAGQIDPLLVGVLRTVIAGLVAFPILLGMRLRLPTDTRGRLLLAYSGTAAFIVFPLLFTVGQHSTSAMHGALILATLPVFTSLFGTLLERRRPKVGWMVGCTIALDRMPLSAPARRWLDRQLDRTKALLALASGGDDYEVVAVADAAAAQRLILTLAPPGRGWTALGVLTDTPGLAAEVDGQPVPVERTGWSHLE